MRKTFKFTLLPPSTCRCLLLPPRPACPTCLPRHARPSHHQHSLFPGTCGPPDTSPRSPGVSENIGPIPPAAPTHRPCETAETTNRTPLGGITLTTCSVTLLLPLGGDILPSPCHQRQDMFPLVTRVTGDLI